MSTTLTSAASLSSRFAAVLESLCRIVAARGGRDRAAVPMVMLVWPYLRRTVARLDSLIRRLQAGKPAQSAAPARPGRTRAPRERPHLPRGFAWLIVWAPESAVIGSQLQHLLADPDVDALLATSPQAGRVLRPLCRMLGIGPSPDVPPTLFPPRPVRKRPAAAPPTPPAPKPPSLPRAWLARYRPAGFRPTRA